jgi:hypothetical protein
MIPISIQTFSGLVSLYWLIQIKQEFFGQASFWLRLLIAAFIILVFASMCEPFYSHLPPKAHWASALLHVLLAGGLFWFVKYHPEIEA